MTSLNPNSKPFQPIFNTRPRHPGPQFQHRGFGGQIGNQYPTIQQMLASVSTKVFFSINSVNNYPIQLLIDNLKYSNDSPVVPLLRAPPPHSFIRASNNQTIQQVTGNYRLFVELRLSASIRAIPTRPGILISSRPCGIS